MMKKLFTGRMTSRTNLAGKSDFSAKQVSTTLLLLLLCLLMPQKGWADIITTTYDFNGTSKEISWSTTTENGCVFLETCGDIADPGRIATQNSGTDHWDLTTKAGLYSKDSGGRSILVSNLYLGDIVTFNVSTNASYGTDVALQSNNASKENNTFTMAAKGSLKVQIPRNSYITSIVIQHDNSGVYEYDPAVEIYDLSGITGGAVRATESAGYTFSSAYSSDALILGNPSGYSLNNRIVVQNDNFQWANGLQNTGTGYRLVGINNLLEGDRVVITFTGTNTVFSSRHDNLDRVFAAAGNVFKDVNNDGELNDGETMITAPNTAVESQAVYTMTADGHLDIALERSQKITKIEIYGDHEAQMLDRFDPATGYTAYFSKTGQLMDKEHNLGGLEIHVGNEDNTQHAIVVSSDEGPVSFVYDQSHYKMARHATWGSFNVWNELPVTGTFYKFIAETNGKITLRMKAYSVRYSNYGSQDATKDGGETQVSSACPYYLMVKNGNTPQQVATQSKYNGATFTFSNITVEAGKTYYLYGWWNGSDLNADCGVAELIDVTFMPDNLVYPLAKYVASGTTSDDHLANVSTTTTNNDLHIKKKSANISSCEPYVEGGVLKIRNIVFAEGQNPGGTILIKVGNPSDDAAPVFAYTIAYDASFNMPEGAARSEGHTWDFSTNPLRGLRWNNTSGEADDEDFGKGAGPGLLYDEMHEPMADGTTHSDWTLKYVTDKGTTQRDPMYLNKYAMEGDNADMMWDTEGLIFNTAPNLSCINNEFGSEVNHNSGGTTTDPDRFVGVRNGGSFTIPLLKAGDRVIIYMGSADAHTSSFNITGALDAIGQTIESTDEYRAGGSLWSTMGGACQYRGAYQFISTGGDMTFTLTKGELVKLYSIQIYRGVKSGSTDCSKTNWNTTYNGVEYIPAYQVNNDWRSETPAACYVQIHYRGKGERLRTPTVLYKSGNINTDADHLFYAEIGENNAPYIFFKSVIGEYGMFRMRVDDMESNGKYVADYALQNMTVGYLEKKNYPYTWDFTDLQDYANTANRIQAERTKIGNYNPKTVDNDKLYDMEFMNNSVGEDVKSVEQWKEYEADGDIPAGYGLQVRNEPYSGGLMWDSNQLYAGNQIFDESFGLRFIAPGQNEKYNGGLRITGEGISLTGGNWKIMIPLVGGEKVASVYVRAKQIGNEEITAGVGDVETSFTYVGTATDGTGEKIYAVKGTGDDMTLVFNNLIIKKIAVSQDTKTVNKLGYATESRNVEIDPELMGYMTGTGLKAYTVTNVSYGTKPGDKASVTLTAIPSENVMGEATSGDHRAYIIFNTDETNKAVSILDGGFHLFVPDMHDKSNASDAKKSVLDVSGNALKSNLLSASIPQEDGAYTNYLMNYKYTGADGKSHEGPEAFYRASKSATLGNNKAYLQLLTANVKPTEANQNGAKFAIIFVDEEANTETTALDGVKSVETMGDNAIYTLSGVKVSKPEKGGIYVKNGKKFIAK